MHYLPWCLALGIFSVPVLPVLPSPVLLVFTALSLILVFRSNRPGWLLCLALLGMTYGSLWGTQQLSSVLPAALDKTDYRVIGVVADLPQVSERRTRLTLNVESLQPLGSGVNIPNLRQLRVSWYGAPAVAAGDRWQLVVRLRTLRGFQNPGGFDYQTWLFANGYSATGYVRDAGANRLLEKNTRFSLTLRQFLTDKINALPNLPESSRGLIQALTVGDQQNIRAEVWDRLRATGTIHLLVVSGLHIGMVALVSLLLGRFVGRLLVLARLAANYHAVSAIVAVIVSGCYGVLAGLGLPVLRALIMTWVAILALLLRRRINVWQGFGWSLCLIAFIDPLAVTQQGFWLSFIAVAGLLAWFAPRPLVNTVGQVFSSQWVILCCLTAVLVFFQGQVSVLAPLINLIAVPWVSLLIVPLCLVGACLISVPLLGDWCWQLAGWNLYWLLQMLDAASGLGIPQYWQPVKTMEPLYLVALGLTGFALLQPKILGLFAPALILLAGLMTAKSQAPDFEVSVLDVGQGLAVVVQVKDKVLVYDTGPAFSDSFDTGLAVVAPFLRTRGIDGIDRLVISHPDNDHAGGVNSLNKSIYIKTIESSFKAKYAGKPTLPCHRNKSWQWHDVHFTYLWPGSDFQDQALLSENNRSCVLLVQYQGVNVLLPGDIEAKIEHSLLNADNLPESIDLLIAPHHGSKTSSSLSFVKHLNPLNVVFSAGVNHQFGHPHESVVRRYAATGSRMWHTGHSGMIGFRWDKSAQLSVVEYSRNKQNYWFKRDDAVTLMGGNYGKVTR